MLKKLQILCLDDDPAQRQALQTVFKYGVETPCEATIVATGTEAREMIKNRVFDLVILDNNLEGETDTGAQIAIESKARGMTTVINTALPEGVDAPEGVAVHEKMTLGGIDALLALVVLQRKEKERLNN